MKKKISYLILVIISFVLILSYMCYRSLQKSIGTTLNLTAPIYLTLPTGSNRFTFEKLLQDHHLLTETDWTSIVIWSEFKIHSIKAGTYEITPNMTLGALLKLLVSGKVAQFAIQFIDGTDYKSWLATLEQADYLKHTITGESEHNLAKQLGLEQYSNLEGLFYPDTYYYTAGTTDVSILRRAAKKMQGILDEVWNNRSTQLPYKTPYQMLIMASMIEKETGLVSEKPLVASVFLNRLKKGIRLQSDPTVIYGMGTSYKGKITSKDLKTYSPYNTYMISGLPPTPIAMVDLSSLQAAAHPANTNYLYFVADGKGGHIFSQTLQQHNKAVAIYIHTLKQNRIKNTDRN